MQSTRNIKRKAIAKVPELPNKPKDFENDDKLKEFLQLKPQTERSTRHQRFKDHKQITIAQKLAAAPVSTAETDKNFPEQTEDITYT